MWRSGGSARARWSALVGPNGAGKSTLLQTLHGVMPRDEGWVRVCGVDPWGDPVACRSRTGFAGDSVELFHVRVRDLMVILPDYYETWDKAWATEVADRLRVEPDWTVGQLSTGQSSRVRLLCALAFRPQLLLLDEPAAGLDLGNRRRLLEIVLGLAGDGPDAVAVVISSHQLRDIERIVDRLLVLHEGKAVREGATHELVHEGQTLEEAMLAWGVAG